jgi:anti-sigma regulatory factor (Ser/Thr protein kinase)
VNALAEVRGVGAGDHVVQFYRHDQELAGQVGGFLAESIRDGGVAIVIATPEHRRIFEDRMADAGIEVAAAAARGDYVALDADRTLARLLTGGRLDPACFDDVVGTLIRDAAGTGRPVRAYGELVALLWEAGLVAAAVELEELWTVLGRRYPFTLWCGYPAAQVSAAGLADSLTDVCRLHSTIIGDVAVPGADHQELVVRREFPASLDAAGQARRFVMAALQADGAGHLADDAALTVTELGTNAVVHAQSGFTVTVTVTGDAVRISVRDAVPLPARRTGPGPALPTAPQHGLGMVAALARRWGTEPAGPGKDVWAELSR